MQSKMIVIKNACPVMLAFAQRWRFDLDGRLECEKIISSVLSLLANSCSTPSVKSDRTWMILDWMSRQLAPAFLKITPSLNVHAKNLKALAKIVDQASADKAIEILNKAEEAAWAVSWSAAWSKEGDAAGGAGGAAIRAAAWGEGGVAIRAAAWGAAGTAIRCATGEKTGDAARDAAGNAARAAEEKAVLTPAIKSSQASALALFKRMAALGDKAPSALSLFLNCSENEARKISKEERTAFLEAEELRECIRSQPSPKVRPPRL